jgi:hypothetical protein
METMIRSELLASLIVVIVLSSVSPPLSETLLAQAQTDSGLIDGTVFYENGKPVKGATVYAKPLGRPIAAIIPHADSDETGYFAVHIPRSWFGKFAVVAKKEDEDYPDMSEQFYSDGKFQTVTLTAHGPAATVKIRLGPKAGVLTGTVADASTGAPLSPCVEFKRASKPNNYLSGSGMVKPKYRLLIPSDTGILIKMSLDGYKLWYYPGTFDKSASRSLRLMPAEEQTLDIRMQPDSGVGSTGCPNSFQQR